MTALFYAHVNVKGTEDYTFVAIFRREDGTYKGLFALEIINIKTLGKLKSFLETISGGSAQNMHFTEEATQREMNAIWTGIFPQ